MVSAVLIQQTIHFGVGSLIYPGVEDFLRDGGFNEETASELAINTRNIITPLPQDKNIADHIFSATELPHLFGLLRSVYSNMFVSSGSALSMPFCSISAESFDTFSIQERLARTIGVRPEDIRDIPNLNTMAFNRLTLHEQGHCRSLDDWSNAYDYIFNWSDIEIQEYEMNEEFSSDLLGLNHVHLVSDEITRDEVAEYVLYNRAASRLYLYLSEYGYAHDITLSLYAEINNITPPTMSEIIESRRELSDLIREKLSERGYQNRSNFEWDRYIPSYEQREYTSTRSAELYVGMVREVLEENNLSFWAQKRAELYLESVDYFSPVVSQNIEAKSTPNPPKLP